MIPQATLLIAGLLCAGAAFAQTAPAPAGEPIVAIQVVTAPPNATEPAAAPVQPQYALIESPTLPCAPAYCPRLAPRADRN